MARAPIATAAAATPSARRDALRERIRAAGATGFLVSDLANIRYLTGFSGSAGILVVSRDGQDLFVTDGRYEIQAASEVDPTLTIEIGREKLLSATRKSLAERGHATIAFEARHLAFADWTAWRDADGPALIPTEDWIERLREIKAEIELTALRRAGEIADRALATTLERVEAGMTERDLALCLRTALLASGAEGEAFESIVLFGPRSALPHGRPSGQVLRSGDVILFDFGARFDGYRSDVSRVVAWEDPAEELKRAYAVVLAAQKAALAGIRAKMTGAEADAIARAEIAAAGYGDRFTHGLGHGVGLEIHESPSLSRTSDRQLERDMVVTVEPGIYIEGLGGIRIEDTVRIGSTSVEALTSAPKDEFIVLS